MDSSSSQQGQKANVIVLTHPEDWEPWLKQVRAYANPDIWPHIDPDETAPQQGLLSEPALPRVQDLQPSVASYFQLSTTNQKTYENARRFYDMDKKYYDKQQEHLRDIRWYISSHVTEQKGLLLKPDESVRQWLEDLKEGVVTPSAILHNDG